ncbi:hypothetical protein [Ornithinimicrobium sp. INDO-MA30-4]|uniref:hypothetical protein n=1 Tax=Ornithinimicrobium sp. INDO-MA30-4 TaxID=2908651 RepID=UPI001F3C83AD|nr:hypothetical protein [Ornithinimicrobium sp. INDO-MA30-4]UJH71538.1 hypothetical protein L0A91_07690 [Ornithinimicrobium sp. INDO-MA30-4]
MSFSNEHLSVLGVGVISGRKDSDGWLIRSQGTHLANRLAHLSHASPSRAGLNRPLRLVLNSVQGVLGVFFLRSLSPANDVYWRMSHRTYLRIVPG